MTALFIESLRRELPPVFSRQVAARNLSGILSVSTLQNLDCKGEGAPSTRMGRTICYEKDSFLTWLEARMQPRRKGKIGEAA